MDWWLGLGCLKLNDQGATDAPAEPPELSHYLIKLTTSSPRERKQSVNARAARGKHPRRRSATAGLAGPALWYCYALGGPGVSIGSCQPERAPPVESAPGTTFNIELRHLGSHNDRV